MALTEITELLIPLAPGSAEPIHRQVYRGIREAILTGRLPPGVRIPSSRRLAEDLELSRSTVLVAFEQLTAEGYLVGAVGSGSYVARQLPDDLLQANPVAPSPAAPAPAGKPSVPRLSQRSGRVGEMPRRSHALYPKAFWTGVPPVDEFPLSLWSRLAARRHRSLAPAQLYHGPAVGYAPLREAIAVHLASARGVRCIPDQVIILSSAQEGLELACRVLLDPGDAAWLEDPAWYGARAAFLGAGAEIVPVPVDGEGLDVSRGVAMQPEARVAYVTPSHQFPMGVTLSLERRRALLRWAATRGAWILEDDYDSEFRYTGRPLPALQGLDADGRVIYIGTFNKTVFPALRLGYVVVPPALVEAFRRMRSVGGQHAPVLDQAVLTDFIAEGHYARHLRRMGTICRARRDALIEAARREAPDLLEIAPVETGLHTIGWLPPGIDDRRAADAAFRQGVEAAPLSHYYLGNCPRAGLVLGYSGCRPHEISAAMRRLAAGLREVR